MASVLLVQMEDAKQLQEELMEAATFVVKRVAIANESSRQLVSVSGGSNETQS
jgi:hypothetical protein